MTNVNNQKMFRVIILMLVAVAVGFLHVYPDIKFLHNLGPGFKGIGFLGAGDEPTYLSRIAGIYKGDWKLANTGIYEHQNDPIIQPGWSEFILGSLGKVFGLSIWELDIWCTLVLPMILFILFFKLGERLSGSFRMGIIIALMIMVGYYWLSPSLRVILNSFSNRPLFFTRPISPQFHFIPFLLSLWFILKVITTDKKYWAILAGMTVGMLFYISVFYWTFIYAGMSVYLLMQCIWGNKKEKWKCIILVYIISFILSLPYWYTVWELSSHPNYLESFKRLGGIYTRAPIIPLAETFAILLIILGGYLGIIKRDVKFLFLVSFAIGGMVCLNQQVITGKTLEPMHWQSYTNKIFLIMVLVISCNGFLSKWARNYLPATERFAKKIIFPLLCLLILVLGFIQQNNYYKINLEGNRQLQTMAAPLRWIQENTTKDAVILPHPYNLKRSELITTYTKNYVYISDPFFITSLLSDREIEERYLFALSFFGITEDKAEEFFKMLDGGLFKGMQVHTFYGGNRMKNQRYIERLKLQYAKLRLKDPVSLINQYKVDYILMERNLEKKLASQSEVDKASYKVYDDENYLIYKFKSDHRRKNAQT